MRDLWTKSVQRQSLNRGHDGAMGGPIGSVERVTTSRCGVEDALMKVNNVLGAKVRQCLRQKMQDLLAGQQRPRQPELLGESLLSHVTGMSAGEQPEEERVGTAPEW